MKTLSKVLQWKTIFLLGFLCFFCGSFQAMAENKVEKRTMYVGDSFTVDPWGELKVGLSMPFCHSTSCIADQNSRSAFSITEVSRSNTTSIDWGKGYYCTYRVEALQAGSFLVYASAYITYGWRPYTSGSHSITYNITVKEKPKVVSITIPSTLSLAVGKAYTFSPTIKETGATTTLKWTTSNKAVATITSAGKVTAVAPGKATITCTAENGVSAKCTLTVTPISISGITLNKTELELYEGDQYALTATITPTNATNKTVSWTSTSNSVAIVGTAGKVVAVGEGYCYITATANDGSGKKADCLVHVQKKPVMVESVSLTTSKAYLTVGETLALTATVLPANATNASLSWSSSDVSKASVNNGVITAQSVGDVTITATTTDGSNVSATCLLSIEAKDSVGRLVRIINELLAGKSTISDVKIEIDRILCR